MSREDAILPPGLPGTVPITAFSVEDLARDGIFRFAPPLIERSPRPKALYLMWRSFQYVFEEIVDPRSFPPLPTAPAGEDLTICRRYIVAAEELAESELLCASDSMTVRVNDETGAEVIESSFTSKEIARGFSVLLRQFDSKDEPASFQRVSGRLRKLSGETTDGQAEARCRQIDAWRKAQGVLHGTELPRLARRKIEPQADYGNDHPPTYYLSAYNYGELIHWDSGRETLAVWEKDPFHRDYQRMAFLEAATGLAYVYIGFSEVVRTALGA